MQFCCTGVFFRVCPPQHLAFSRTRWMGGDGRRGQACWRFVQLMSAAAVFVLLILGIVG